jgi:hypothetical protein
MLLFHLALFNDGAAFKVGAVAATSTLALDVGAAFSAITTLAFNDGAGAVTSSTLALFNDGAVAATSTVALDNGAPLTMEQLLPLPLLRWTM